MLTKPTHVDWSSLEARFRKAQAQSSLQNYRRRKWERATEFASWLGETALPDLSLNQADLLYRASGGAKRREFSSNTIADIRDTLDFLLYDTVKLEGRFQECAAEAGAYKLSAAGKEFVSYILCIIDPRLFAVWNAAAENTLRKLGMIHQLSRKSPIGIIYIDLLEATATLARRLGLSDFRDVDEFSHYITRKKTRSTN